jgi:DMSO reductase anchor subunit
MNEFEQGLYYFSLVLFTVANCCFWGLLGYVAFSEIANIIRKKK